MEKISELVTAPGSCLSMLVPIKLGDIQTVAQGGGKLVTNVPESTYRMFSANVEAVPTNALNWEEVRV